jgi:class 3 adenylate cyclase
MEPKIQYCTAPDGVHLAYCTEGKGAPLVLVPATLGYGHIQFEGLFLGTRQLLELLGSRMSITRYDRRGIGLSDRDIVDDSLDAHVSDLLTIIDRLACDRVALYARMLGGPLAIAFADRYPDRVSHLVLGATTASMAAFYQLPRVQSLMALSASDWELFTSVLARLLAGTWTDPKLSARLEAQIRAASSHESVQRLREAIRAWDVTDRITSIRVPTLVISFPTPVVGGDWIHLGRDMASAIPGAGLVALDDEADAAPLIHEFVTGEQVLAAAVEPSLPEGTAIILFADIVDSTALTEQLGDAAFRARATRLDASMRTGIRECGGQPVAGKVLGDGVMGVFTSARHAIAGAQRCLATADGTGLALHLGLHAGDVIREDDNVYGGAVNIASRICGLCEPGEILVSQTVRDLARTSAGATFDDRGEHAFKGITDPVRVFAVRAGA